MLASLRQSVSCRYVRPRPAIYVAQLFCQRLTANKRHFWTNAQEKHFIDIKPKPWYPPELEFAYHNIQHPSSPDVDLWIKCLEGFLPEDLRQQDSLGSTLPVSTTANVFGYLLSKARDYAELDLLWHMGVVQERWDVVAHIVKIVAREWVPRGKSLDRVQTASGINWPKEVLDSITDAPIELDNITSSNIGENYLDFMTGEDEDTRWMEWGLQHKRFGQIWRSLGNMILFASAQSSEDSKKIMKHVLELLAMLHHHSIIPESTYNAPVSSGPAALQQPPTLHILSSRILTALSDAAWNAHITSAVAAANKVNPLATKNYEVPGSRHKVFVGQLGHEVWLELVLWSCLHGGWALDGAKILEKMQEYKGDLSWSLISWKDVFEFSNLSTKPATLSDWIQVKYEADRNQSAASPEARRVVERTVSVELIAAYVDGLVNTIHVGVGDRGTYPGEVLHHLEHLKLLLDRHKMGLGFTTWENVLIRLQESGGVVLENDPQLMLKILGLIQPYGKEFESVNNRIPSTHTSPSVPDYIFDSSAASLGLLHRVLKSFIDRKDVGGALDAFSAVQFFTDLNKRRSLETFFQDLRNPTIRNQLERRGHFLSSTPAEEIYPALFPQIPFTVLGPLLELMAEAKLFALGDHLIYAKDIDGPVIPSDQYRDPTIAAALIRYGVASGRRQLVQHVLTASAHAATRGATPAIPPAVLAALLESELARRQWDSAATILRALRDTHAPWPPRALPLLAKHMLLLQRDVREARGGPAADVAASLASATALLQDLALGRFGSPAGAAGTARLRLHGLLGLLASLDAHWAAFAAPLAPPRGSQPFALEHAWFDVVLEGVVEACGPRAAKRLWDVWTEDVSRATRLRVPTGGVARVPKVRTRRASEMVDPGNRVVLTGLPTGAWEFRGRLKATLGSLRIIMMGIEQFKADGRLKEDEDGVDLRAWSVQMLKMLTDGEPHTIEAEMQRVKTALSSKSYTY